MIDEAQLGMIDGAEIGLPRVLYVAGSAAPPGSYRRVNGAPREVEIGPGERLPPSFDGSVALYARMALARVAVGRPRSAIRGTVSVVGSPSSAKMLRAEC